MLLACAAEAQTTSATAKISAYELLTHLIGTDKNAAAIAPKIASSDVDAEGMVGTNRRGWKNSDYPNFLAEEQRGAFSNMVEGVLLNDDKNLYIGWQALMAAYAHQQPEGDFGPAPKGCKGTSCMRFFMNASNQALVLLLESPSANKRPPHSELTYRQLVEQLLPKIQLALDFMLGHATHDIHDQLLSDFVCPNRAMMDSNGFAFGYLLLQKYSTPEKLAAYDAEAQWWVSDIFRQSRHPMYTYRALADPKTGVFWEGNKWNGFVYDSNYGAVGLAQMVLHALYFPEHFRKAGIDPMDFLKKSGDFVLARMSADTAGGVVVDATNDTRTGPIPNPETGKADDFSITEARMAMFYYAALFHRPEGVRVISSPAHYRLVFGRPPVIFNDVDTRALTVKRGAAMTSYTVYTTNAGVQDGATQILDPKFTVTAQGLPPGVTLSAAHSYAPELHLDQGLGMAELTGTPTKRGVYDVVVKAVNQYGEGKPVTFVLTVE